MQVIQNHPKSLDIYQNTLLESGKVSKEDIERINNKVNSILNEEFNKSKDYVPKKRDWLSAYWAGFKSPEQISRIQNTGYYELSFVNSSVLIVFPLFFSPV